MDPNFYILLLSLLCQLHLLLFNIYDQRRLKQFKMHDEIVKTVEGIKESFPHLESQIDIILNIFGERRQKTYGSVFVYGQPGTGAQFAV